MAESDVRMTVRLPAAAARFLDAEAKENYTSRNAELVRAIRTAMQVRAQAGPNGGASEDHGDVGGTNSRAAS